MMPIQTAILTPNGLQETDYKATSLADAAQYEPDGVYTVARTFRKNQALRLDSHLARLEESARLEAIPLVLDRAALRKALRQLIKQGDYPDSRFRITIPRQNPDHIYLALEPRPELPSEIMEQGAKVATIPVQRQNPLAKDNAWVQQREAATANLPDDIYQALLVSPSGELLEGVSSNFFGIMGDTLRTAGEGILLGVTLKLVLEVAANLLKVEQRAVHLDEIPQLSEAFFTSSSRGIVPITEINGIKIGDGKPGQWTREIDKRYQELMETKIEPI